MKINYTLTNEHAREPRRAHDTDAGSDLYFPRPEEHIYELPPGRVISIQVGVAVEIPEGHFGLVTGRSSLNKKGILCYPGIIDSHYRGEITVLLEASQSTEIRGGDRIAQLIILPCVQPQFNEVSELTETVRGANGFGSTGK